MTAPSHTSARLPRESEKVVNTALFRDSNWSIDPLMFNPTPQTCRNHESCRSHPMNCGCGALTLPSLRFRCFGSDYDSWQIGFVLALGSLPYSTRLYCDTEMISLIYTPGTMGSPDRARSKHHSAYPDTHSHSPWPPKSTVTHIMKLCRT